MPNTDNKPDPRSKRGVAFYIMRRHVAQQTGATPEAVCAEIFATGRFQDYREVVQGFYDWLIRNGWVMGLKEHPALARRSRSLAAPIPSGGISIRDPEVGELARELAKLRKTNMTEAIAHALHSELKRERDKRPLRERLKELAQQLKAEVGPNPKEVTKDDIDAMWGQ